jgi:hypothetical protein|nr:DUF1292 domain-containing protein [uncultured Lachnoclostridium sp.]
MEENRKVSFFTEDNEEVIFYVLEQTKLNGTEYLLVTEDINADEADAYILKDVSEEESLDAVYDMVEDDNELEAIAAVFEELLEDTDIVTE